MTKDNVAEASNGSHAEAVTTLTLAKSQPHSSRRILVVEDDTGIRGLCSDALIKSGYQVNTAEDGKAAWKVLQAARHDPDSYHLLITDNHMPKLSGIELIKKLRSAHMILPVILATGAAPMNDEYLHLAESLQLAAILSKPFSTDWLRQTVKKILHTGNCSKHYEWATDANQSKWSDAEANVETVSPRLVRRERTGVNGPYTQAISRPIVLSYKTRPRSARKRHEPEQLCEKQQ